MRESSSTIPYAFYVACCHVLSKTRGIFCVHSQDPTLIDSNAVPPHFVMNEDVISNVNLFTKFNENQPSVTKWTSTHAAAAYVVGFGNNIKVDTLLKIRTSSFLRFSASGLLPGDHN